MEPQHVNPNVRWWFRVWTHEAAKAARQAHQKARQSENWAEDMTPEEMKSYRWALEGDDGEDRD